MWSFWPACCVFATNEIWIQSARETPRDERHVLQSTLEGQLSIHSYMKERLSEVRFHFVCVVLMLKLIPWDMSKINTFNHSTGWTLIWHKNIWLKPAEEALNKEISTYSYMTPTTKLCGFVLTQQASWFQQVAHNWLQKQVQCIQAVYDLRDMLNHFVNLPVFQAHFQGIGVICDM